MRQFVQDVRYAWRGFLRSPLFASIAVASIALGVGANTAIFALVDEVIVRLLPVKDPGELVLFNGAKFHYGSNSGGNMLSFPMYEDFRDDFVDREGAPAAPRVSQAVPNAAPTPKIFSGLFARRPIAMNVGIDGQTERANGDIVSGTYFSTLGVGAALGRVIAPDDDRVKGAEPIAVLGYDYWRTRFGADPNVVGRSILVNNTRLIVVGVAARGFLGLDIASATNLFVPITMKAQMTPDWDDMENRRSRWANVFGRLKAGVTREQALAAVQPYFHGLLEQEVQMAPFSDTTAYTREQFVKGQVDLLPASQGRSVLRRQLTQPLYLLFGVVAGVLLIACANVASLLIARAVSRQKEIAVRLALGAGRARIVRQLLVESLTLALLGGLVGLVVASWTTRTLLGFLPTLEPSTAISGAIDYRVMAFNLALSVLTGIGFGLVPAFRATSPDLAPTLKDQVGSVVGGGVGVRKALVVAQVAISVVLLIGAGLFIRTLRNLRVLDLGIEPTSVVAFNVSPAISGYTPAQTPTLYKSMVDRLRAEPGVQGVALASIGLLEGGEWDSSVSIEGYQAKPGENMNPYCNSVTPGYFRTMGTPVLRGREFEDRDSVPLGTTDPKAPYDGRGNGYSHVVVNESFAKHYFGDRDPIGRHIGFGGNPGTPTPIEIVGVVKDSKYMNVRDDIPRTIFLPLFEELEPHGVVAYVKASSAPDSVFGAVRATMRAIDPNVPLYNLRTLEQQVDRSLFVERFIATLSTAFGVLATLLAVVGLYGVMSYMVARRTREIGVRMALGARAGDVVWLVMREVLGLVTAGVAVGLVAALALSRLIGSSLFGIGANDPTTVAGAAVLLALIGLLAGYAPARRATRVNPTRALRYE